MLKKCQQCDKDAVYHVLVEDDENPNKSHIIHLCQSCLDKAKSADIDIWTDKEWDE